jgi:hypothetical protein
LQSAKMSLFLSIENSVDNKSLPIARGCSQVDNKLIVRIGNLADGLGSAFSLYYMG